MYLPFPNLRRFLFLALFAGLICLPAPGLAQSPSVVTLAAQAGFDGYCKNNHWIPIFVTLENSGPELDGRIEVRLPGQGTGSSVLSMPVSLGTTARKLVEMDIYPEGYVTSLDVSLYTGNKQVSQVSAKVNCQTGNSNVLIGVVAGSPSAFNLLSNLAPANGKADVAQIDLARLPSQARSLDSLDLIVFADIDTGGLTPEQQQALGGWLAGGGQILIAGGPGWQKTAAGLTDFLPFQPQGTQTISSLGALQAYSSSDQPISGEAVIATGTPQSKAIVLSEQDGLPLLVWQAHGAGSVTYTSFDPSLSPVKNWDGLELLYQRLFARHTSLPVWSSGIQDWNLASQAATSLPNQSLPSGLMLCGFLSLYVAAIGPFNYIVLKRMKRRELAWLSIPVLVVLFSGLAFLLGRQARGNLPILNRLAIVQVYPGAKQARIDGLVGVFSPNRSTYRLDFSPNLTPHPIPDVYGNPANVSLVQTGSTNSVDHLQVDVGAIQPVAFQGQTAAPEFDSDLRLTTGGPETQVEGTITNRSNLILKDAVFLAPGRAQTLGSFQPGETKDILVKLDTSQRSGQNVNSAPMYGYSGPIYPGNYPYPSGDTTLADIVGTSNYYDNPDSYRRFSLAGSVLGLNSGGGRGGGFFLAGWSDAFPEETALFSGTQKQFESSDHSLYLVSFQPEIQAGDKAMTFSPGAFTWTALEGPPNIETSPYNTYLTSPGMTLQFDLIQSVSYSAVQSLILHLQGTNSPDPSHLEVSLWDVQTQAWQKQDVGQWGDYSVPDPEKYITPSGQVRLKIGLGAGQFTETISRSDFTVVLEP